MRGRTRKAAGEKGTPHAAAQTACSLDRLPQRVSQCQRADGVLRVSGQRLTLLAMTGEELRIGGLIDRVEWVTGC